MSINYIPQVPGGILKVPGLQGEKVVDRQHKRVIAYHQGTYYRFQLKPNGKLERAGHVRPGSSLSQGEAYIPKEHFVGIVRQVYGILKGGNTHA